MAHPFDPFHKLHELHRLHDSLGLGRIGRITDQFRSSALHDALQAPAMRGYMSSNLHDIVAKLQSTLGGGEFERVRAITESIGRFTGATAALSNQSVYRVSELWKSISGPSMAVSRQLDAMFGLDGKLSRLFPTEHLGWKADLDRSTMPWLEAHKAIWPHDAGVLRMLDKGSLGVASWLSDESPEIEAMDTTPHFDLGALVAGGRRDAAESTPLAIKVHVRCSICKGPIFGADSAVDWLGPKDLDLTIDIVPFCSECTQRELDEPGFVAAWMRETFGDSGEPAEPERLQLSISSGDETDPIARGELRLVRDDDRNDEE